MAYQDNNQYKFEKMHLVAHSMGGLVARGFVNNCNTKGQCEYISTFITVSTPWGGHDTAMLGLKNAPVIVPVWKDMAPGSAYRAWLFSLPKPKSIPHYLLYTEKAESYIGTKKSDGAVTVESQLLPIAQDQASVVYGYMNDHVGILSDPKLIRDLMDFFSANE